MAGTPTTNYSLPTIADGDVIDGVNAINGLANAVDTALYQVEQEGGAPVMRNGQPYRASQAIPSTQGQYPPETAGESLYYPVEIAPDGIIVYRTCHGEYDMVRKGEKRHYPNADSPVYVALEDTAYSPDAYPQHWELDQAEAE